MRSEDIQELLRAVAAGEVAVDRAVERLATLPFEKLEELAIVDHHRELRTGSPEIVFGEGKSADQIAAIMGRLAAQGAGALATRVDAEKASAVQGKVACEYHPNARTLRILPRTPRSLPGVVGVIAAGTSDLPVADEAAVALEFLGARVERISDIGVSGLHRLVSVLPALRKLDALVVIAGMEGALPTVLAGLVPAPIVAVPTSIGYGVGHGGLSALSSMLSSCAPGLSVVNIDNGLGAAMVIARVLQVQS